MARIVASVSVVFVVGLLLRFGWWARRLRALLFCRPLALLLRRLGTLLRGLWALRRLRAWLRSGLRALRRLRTRNRRPWRGLRCGPRCYWRTRRLGPVDVVGCGRSRCTRLCGTICWPNCRGWIRLRWLACLVPGECLR